VSPLGQSLAARAGRFRCDRTDGAALALAAGVPFFFYSLFGTARYVTGEDAGELIAAAYCLGVPHPPGYPLWVLLAHAFTYLPFGSVAFRVAWMSTIFAAMTLLAVALIVLERTRSRRAAVLGAWVLATAFEFREQAYIVEVYTLNCFFIAACILLLFLWDNRRDPKWLYAFAAVYGLSLGNHFTMPLLGPVFGAFILWRDRPWNVPRYGRMLAVAALGVLPYLMLYIRSQADPPMDWSNPETLTNLWRMMSRQQYTFMATEGPRSWTIFCGQLGQVAAAWSRQWPPYFGYVVIAAPLYWLIRRDGRGLWMLVLAGVVVLGFVQFQNPRFTREWEWVMSVFWLPLYLVNAVAFAQVAAPLARRLRLLTLGAIVVVVALVLPVVSDGTALPRKRDYRYADEHARNIFATLAPEAIYIPRADHATFPVLYRQIVEGDRPDVFIARRYGYLEPELTAHLAPDRRAAIGAFPPRRYEPEILASLIEHTQLPLYFSDYPRFPDDVSVDIVPAGLLYRALRPGEAPPSDDIWARYTFYNRNPAAARGEYTRELIAFDIWAAATRRHLYRGNLEKAAHAAQNALRAYGRNKFAFNNLGTIYARHSAYMEAAMLFREALNRDPHNLIVQHNFERAIKKAGLPKATLPKWPLPVE